MREWVEQRFASAGIEPGGTRPWDIQIHDPAFYQRVWSDRNLGLGECYVEGGWDCRQLDEFFARLLRSGVEEGLRPTPSLVLRALAHRLFNFQTRGRSREVIEKHYDLGNDLFRAMLDSRMNYSCGYWKGARSLEEAQVHKLELVCQKLMLKPGMRLLDIGCGWGALAKHAAEHYGAKVLGVTLSLPQKVFAEEACRGLPVTFQVRDYRELPDQAFDRVASIGMFEHVGHKNFKAFMDLVRKHLTEDGIFLLHSIGGNSSKAGVDPWIAKYIFPNGELPSQAQISHAMEGRFVLEDWHNFGADYDRTLMAWYGNFTEHWPRLKARFDERFFRIWSYYLLSCAGAFRARSIQLWQVVMTKHGLEGGYRVRDLQAEGRPANAALPGSEAAVEDLVGLGR
ncbi:MAG: cyclopropane fatty acyl phospholipid synthase [Geothrix sp.]|nr:cyclopropane fatty acyl phospholipid synthase [Geothrix sp.]